MKREDPPLSTFALTRLSTDICTNDDIMRLTCLYQNYKDGFHGPWEHFWWTVRGKLRTLCLNLFEKVRTMA